MSLDQLFQRGTSDPWRDLQNQHRATTRGGGAAFAHLQRGQRVALAVPTSGASDGFCDAFGALRLEVKHGEGLAVATGALAQNASPRATARLHAAESNCFFKENSREGQ